MRSKTPISVEVVRPEDRDAEALIAELDAYLDPLYPPESQHGLDVASLGAAHITFFIARYKGRPVGCGGLKQFNNYGELSRLYVRPQSRGLGIAQAILERVEKLARDAGLKLVLLETGNLQPEALAFYHSAGYRKRSPFGTYRPHPNCIFMEKVL